MKISVLFSVSIVVGAVSAMPVNGSRPAVTVDEVRGEIPENAVLGFLDLSDVEDIEIKPVQTGERSGLLFVNRHLSETGTGPTSFSDIAKVYKRMMNYDSRGIISPAITL
ncbi:AaceriAFL062Wp [[Ashbya] aceris (nom. inval.)]|nr:AaceriAFL062Wp [[Ashbya] aceris (nom. inval.)]